MSAVNNVDTVLDSYCKKPGYKQRDTAKDENAEQVSPQEEPGVILSIGSNEQSIFGGTQSEMETVVSQMLKNLEGSEALDAEAMLISAKQQILNMLIKSARMLLSTRYTSKSWKGLVEALKQSLPLTGSDKAVMLDKAISIMQGGLAGLELTEPSQDDDGVREQLPVDQSVAGKGTASETAAQAVATGGAAGAVVNAVNISV